MIKVSLEDGLRKELRMSQNSTIDFLKEKYPEKLKKRTLEIEKWFDDMLKRIDGDINDESAFLQKTKAKEQAVVVSKSFEKVLEECSLKNIKFDIIFLDPPYKTDYAEKATEIIVDKNLLNDNGIIIIETDTREKVIEKLQNIDITIYDERKYGRVSLLFLRKE